MRISDWSSDVCSSDLSGEHPGFSAIPSPGSKLRHRIALLMPVYNESVDATFGRVRAMARSIQEAGGGDWIAFFVLSDSNELHSKRELAAWREIAAEAPIPAYYRSEEHTSELQSPMRTSYAAFCLQKKQRTQV